MVELFKEMWDAAGQRLRSPFFGSILFSFVAVNWEALFFLFFAEQKAEVRLAYFASITDWWSLYAIPVGLGVSLALTMPWLKFGGAWVAQFPNKRLHRLQNVEAVSRKIESLNEEKRKVNAETELAVAQQEGRAQVEAAAENRQLEAAKRLEEAGVISEEAQNEILENRSSATTDINAVELSPFDQVVAVTLRHAKSAITANQIARTIRLDPYEAHNFGDFTDVRFETETESSLKRLKEMGFLRRVAGAAFEKDSYSLSKLGYDYFENLSGQKSA